MRAILTGLFLLLTMAPALADPAEDAAWEMARGAGDPAVLDLFLQKYPDGQYAGEARAKLDALSDDGADIRSAPAPQQSEAPNLALAVQRELQRVGCYKGGLDGDWGAGSRRALAAFASSADVSVGSQPTADVLAVVSSRKGRVCAARQTATADSPDTPSRSTSLTGVWTHVAKCPGHTVRGTWTITSADASGIVGRVVNQNGVDAFISGGGVRGSQVTFQNSYTMLGKQYEETWTGTLTDGGTVITGGTMSPLGSCTFVIRR